MNSKSKSNPQDYLRDIRLGQEFQEATGTTRAQALFGANVQRLEDMGTLTPTQRFQRLTITADAILLTMTQLLAEGILTKQAAYLAWHEQYRRQAQEAAATIGLETPVKVMGETPEYREQATARAYGIN